MNAVMKFLDCSPEILMLLVILTGLVGSGLAYHLLTRDRMGEFDAEEMQRRMDEAKNRLPYC